MAEETIDTSEAPAKPMATRVEVVNDFRMGRRTLLSVGAAYEDMLIRRLKERKADLEASGK